jgi:hypothetical protein
MAMRAPRFVAAQTRTLEPITIAGHWKCGDKTMGKPTLIAESFDPRTLANMDVALERACDGLAAGSEDHRVREFIASKILERARGGDRTLGGLTQAGRIAASMLGGSKAGLTSRPARQPSPSRRAALAGGVAAPNE